MQAAESRIKLEPMAASVVADNGRRGAPRPGCDCEQCFGYCFIDSDEAVRVNLAKHERRNEE